MKKLLALFLLPLVFSVSPRLWAQSAPYSNTAGLSTTLVVASASGCYLTGYNMANPNSAIVYVQFFNAATTAGITLGTTAPFFVIAIPPFAVNDGTPCSPPVSFSAGVVIAATTTPAGMTAPSTAIPLALFKN